MVCSRVGGESERVRESMSMGTERSKPLHNFTLPGLRWGGQKHLRCMKEVESSVAGGVGGVSSAVDRRSSGSRFFEARRRQVGYERKRFARDSERRAVKGSKSKIDGDGGIEAVREKLMFDLKTAADKMKDAILREEAEGDEVSGVAPAPAPAPAEDARPWNLRIRRAACKAPLGGDGGGKGVLVEEKNPSYSPLPIDGAKSPTLRGSLEKKERSEFSVSLSRKEIEDDFLAMLGSRPPRRPKKRQKNVQKQLDTLFPGLWLTEVSEDMYKVPELPVAGKR